MYSKISLAATCLGLVFLVVYSFTFQSAEKAFHQGVIKAVGSPAHTNLNAIGGHDLSDPVTRILAAAVGMMEQSRICG